MAYVKDKKKLTMFLANKYFKFLIKYYRQDVISLADSMEFLLCGRMKTQEASRAIQRHLYRLAKKNGWRKNKKKNYRWENQHCQFTEKEKKLIY